MVSWLIREVRSWILRWVFVSASHCRSRDEQVRLDGHDGSALDATGLSWIELLTRVLHSLHSQLFLLSHAIMGRAGYRRAQPERAGTRERALYRRIIRYRRSWPLALAGARIRRLCRDADMVCGPSAVAPSRPATARQYNRLGVASCGVATTAAAASTTTTTTTATAASTAVGTAAAAAAASRCAAAHVAARRRRPGPDRRAQGQRGLPPRRGVQRPGKGGRANPHAG